MSLIVIILIIIAFLGFGTVSQTTTVETVDPVITEVEGILADGWTLVNVNGVDGVIVAPEDAIGLGLAEPFWAPSVTDVFAAEAAIADSEGELDHYRQYIGFTENGDQKILVNGFCNPDASWTSQVVFVMDGGDCYFTGIYNVDTDELESFTFNGDA
jgi:hypothetical protein